jgi:hypothetical protein
MRNRISKTSRWMSLRRSRLTCQMISWRAVPPPGSRRRLDGAAVNPGFLNEFGRRTAAFGGWSSDLIAIKNLWKTISNASQ